MPDFSHQQVATPPGFDPLFCALGALPNPQTAPTGSIIGVGATATWDGDSIALSSPHFLEKGQDGQAVPMPLTTLLARNKPLRRIHLIAYAALNETYATIPESACPFAWQVSSSDLGYDMRTLWALNGCVSLLDTVHDPAHYMDEEPPARLTRSAFFHASSNSAHGLLAAQHAATHSRIFATRALMRWIADS